MADRLVHLSCICSASITTVVAGRALVRPEKRCGLLGDPRAFAARSSDSTYSQPVCALGPTCARVAPCLDDPVGDRGRRSRRRTRRAGRLGLGERKSFTRGARTPAWATFVGVLQASSARMQSATLSSGRRQTGRFIGGRKLPERASSGASAQPFASAAARRRRRECGVPRALGAQAAVAGEAPGAVDERGRRFLDSASASVHATVPRPDRLAAAHDCASAYDARLRALHRRLRQLPLSPHSAYKDGTRPVALGRVPCAHALERT